MKNIDDKIYLLVYIIIFFITLPLSIFVNWGFLGFVGFSIGYILGYYVNHKTNRQFKKESLYFLFAIIGIALVSSAIIFYFLNIKGLNYIIGINVILMIAAIIHLIRNTKEQSVNN